MLAPKYYDVEEYICEKMLDAMEKKRFSEIKITEFVSSIEIGRSTFYMHFDSIYAVIQRLEDNYLYGYEYYGSQTAKLNLDNNAEMLRWLSYVKKNLRLFRILSGPNGDPGFEARLENWMRKIFFNSDNVQNVTDEVNFLQSYHIGGVIYAMKWWAVHEDSFDDKQILSLIQKMGKAGMGLFDSKHK